MVLSQRLELFLAFGSAPAVQPYGVWLLRRLVVVSTQLSALVQLSLQCSHSSRMPQTLQQRQEWAVPLISETIFVVLLMAGIDLCGLRLKRDTRPFLAVGQVVVVGVYCS